ncbi:MAG: glycosyltransferase [Anaerolineales bacterium]
MVASSYPRFLGDVGAGRTIQAIAEALVNHGHEVHVLAPYHPSLAPYPTGVCRHHFRYIWPDSLAIMGYAQALQNDQALHPAAYWLSVPFLLAGVMKLIRLQQAHQFDVIHAHWVIPNGAMAAMVARAFRVPLVISLHGSDIFLALRQPLLGQVARWAFERASAVTACSPDLLDGALRLGSPAQHTYPIVWGADPVVFGSQSDASSLRERWRIEPDACVVLSLGRLVQKKGLDVLLKAIPIVVRRVPHVRFIIAGAGPQIETLKAQATALQVSAWVTFTGEVNGEEVPLYLNLCDVFVVPSVYDPSGNADGLPVTVLEAMASAKPVVASHVAGIPWVVKDGDTGLLVPPAQPESLADALITLLADAALRSVYGLRARAVIETELNWNRIADKFVAWYAQAREYSNAGAGIIPGR